MKTSPARPRAGQVWVCRDGRTLEPDFFTGADLTGFTPAQLAYGSAAGGLTQDANLSWSGSSLAITGAATISSTLAVSGATTVDLGTGADPATALSGTVLTVRNADATNNRILGVAFGANGLILSGRGVGGTRALPTATTNGQVLCQFTGFGYNGTTYPTSSSGLYSISAGSLWTASNQETLHEWRCTPNGSTTNTQRMVLYGSGNLCLGSSPADDGVNNLQVAGTVSFSSDADGTHVIGRTKIGTFVASDTMGFAHFDNANTTDFCLNQSAAGTTNFNAKSGQNCIFTIGGASKMTLNTSSLTLNTGVPLTLSDTTASTSTGTGALIVGGGGGFSGQVNAITFASRHAGSGSWTGSAYSGTDYTASDTANAPFFRAINTNSGGYDSGFIAYQSTSTGAIKPTFLFGCVGTGAWTNGTVASQTSDMYFLLRDNADAMIERLRITNLGNVILGKRAALATNATDGFTYVPTCAGTPTGVPTSYTGKVAIVVDTTNHKLYFYDGSWRDAGP